MEDYKLELKRALELADIADEISMRHLRANDLVITTKPDNTPVTQADKEIEVALQKTTTKWGDGYLGEEGARTASDKRVWIVDPIDGTKNFLRSMPIWATLIALTENGETIASVVSAPALGRRWWAAKGQGAWTKDVDGSIRQVRVSGVNRLSDTFLVTSSLDAWDEVPTGLPRLIELIKKIWRHRSIGDFWIYMLVAEGAADACTEPGIKLWDTEAPKLVVTEAGGSFWTDATTKTAPTDSRTALATNGKLEAQIKQALNL